MKASVRGGEVGNLVALPGHLLGERARQANWEVPRTPHAESMHEEIRKIVRWEAIVFNVMHSSPTGYLPTEYACRLPSVVPTNAANPYPITFLCFRDTARLCFAPYEGLVCSSLLGASSWWLRRNAATVHNAKCGRSLHHVSQVFSSFTHGIDLRKRSRSQHASHHHRSFPPTPHLANCRHQGSRCQGQPSAEPQSSPRQEPERQRWCLRCPRPCYSPGREHHRSLLRIR